jgi:hypothetical protein
MVSGSPPFQTLLSFANTPDPLAKLRSGLVGFECMGLANSLPSLFPGGLHLKGNPWICDCGLIWLSMWLKRWLREALQIHTKLLESSQQIQILVREATCYDPKTNAYIPIIDLNNEYVVCSASALSASSHVYSDQFRVWFRVYYFVLYPLLYYYFAS